MEWFQRQRRRTKVLLVAAVAVVVLALVGALAPSEPAEDSAPQTVATERPTQATTAAPSIFQTKYSPDVQTRIDRLATERDCAGLRREFDTAEANNDATRTRTGSGTADLMQYIDGKQRAAGCIN